jgi:hypothetical protein
MAIYAGSDQCRIVAGDEVCDLDTYSPFPITNGVRLLSSDDYVLKDKNNIYITFKKEDE